ncbi:glycosyltransferase [Aquihabitans daechungensis]|uniref:glycosyltransferase n=1 Tax=Aquihabitans daechungensis TaxID=1052257 RepID=UPI003B9E13F2
MRDPGGRRRRRRVRTLIDHGETGFLVEQRDPRAFAAAVRTLLADPAMAARMGADAAQRAQGYTWSTAAARLRRVYADLSQRSLVDCAA